MSKHPRRKGKTVVIVLRDDVAQGIIALRDETARHRQRRWRKLNALEFHRSMLTGDNSRTALFYRRRLGNRP